MNSLLALVALWLSVIPQRPAPIVLDSNVEYPMISRSTEAVDAWSAAVPGTWVQRPVPALVDSLPWASAELMTQKVREAVAREWGEEVDAVYVEWGSVRGDWEPPDRAEVHTTAAKQALDGGIEAIKPLEAGPAELRELSVTFATLFGRLCESKSEVEAEVRERTAELLAASRSQQEFLANMSHEIRTPMTAILGFVEALRESDCAEAEKVEYLDIIHRNGTHLLGLINDILDFSKLEVGRMEAERIACSPDVIIDDVIGMLRGRANDKGITLEKEYAGPFPRTIESDPTRLRQILFNLVGNSIKFTESGSVRIRMDTPVSLDTVRATLRFDVIDTGIGIPQEKLDSLFQPFEQAESSHARCYGGTGLGLAISSQLAQLLGGELTVESQLGRGSRFRLDIDLGTGFIGWLQHDYPSSNSIITICLVLFW